MSPAARASNAAKERRAPILVHVARKAWTRERAPAQTNRAASIGLPITTAGDRGPGDVTRNGCSHSQEVTG